MTSLSALLLIVTPGAWIAFTLPGARWGFWLRTALAIALSPAVLAAEYCVLRWADVGFDQTCKFLAQFNLVALLPVAWCAVRTLPRSSPRRVIAGLAVYLAVAACVAIPWLFNSDFRRFSWHGLLHTDICYALERDGLRPEEPTFAGYRLAYPWLGHVTWTVIGRLQGMPPTKTYVLTNLASLLACGILVYRLALDLGASVATSLASTVLLAIGANIVGVIGWSILPPNDNGLLWAVLGDLRYAPFAVKYCNFEVMTFGLTLFAALLWCAAAALRDSASPTDSSAARSARILTPLLLAALAAIYPNLFPAAVLLCIGWLILLWRDRRAAPRPRAEVAVE